MARVATYLNFPRCTEEAFLFYRSVFGGEFLGGIRRFADAPATPDSAPVPESDRNLVTHVALPILGGHVLMGTDTPDSIGFTLKPGNNIHINLDPDTRADTERLFRALSAGGTITTPLQEAFWGGYFGTITDRFGIQWMFNCLAKT